MPSGRLRIGYATGARLVSDQGAIDVVGKPATLRKGKNFSVAAGAVAVTGRPVNFKIAHKLLAAQASVSVVGKAANLGYSGAPSLTVLNQALMGGNMNTSKCSSSDPIFSNAVDQARGFSAIGTNYTAVPVDANGYPTVNSFLTLCATSYSNGGNTIAGQSYAMSWIGAQSAFPDSGSGYTITGKSGPDGTGKCTATFNCTANTVIGINVNAPMTNPRIMRPGLPENFASKWNPAAIAYYKQFSGIRYMKDGGAEWTFIPPGVYDLSWSGGGNLVVNAPYQGTLTNGGVSPCQLTVITGEDMLLYTAQTIPANTVFTIDRAGFPAGTFKVYQLALSGSKPNYLNPVQDMLEWSERYGRTHLCVNGTETLGISIDDQVSLSNALFAASSSNFKWAWFCVPHNATDAYITSMADFIRDNLNPAINAVIELSNETWNITTYRSYYWQYYKAVAEVGAGGSNLNYDGSTDATMWRRRIHARRTREMAMIFQASFVSEFGTRCQIAMCEQAALSGPNMVHSLRFLRDNYYGSIPGDYIHKAGASYYTFIGANALKIAADGPAVVAYWNTSPTEGRPNLAATAKYWAEDAAIFGINHSVAYEAGPWCFFAVGSATTLRTTNFVAGATAPAIGSTISQGANSALLQSIELTSGAWASGNAAGRFITGSVTPGPFVAGALTGGGVATLSGADATAVINAADILKVANAMDSPEMEVLVQDVIKDFIAVGGKEYNFFNVGGGPHYNELTTANAMGHGTVVNVNTYVPASHKAQGCVDMLPYVLPTPAALDVRNPLPGTINPCATVSGATVDYWRDRKPSPPTPLDWPAFNCSGWAPALNEIGWFDFAIFARTTKTYTVTPSVQSKFNGSFRVLIDDVEYFNSGTMTTSVYPGTAPAVAQTPFTVALTQGWHRMRLEGTSRTAGNQLAFGPTIFV